MERSGRFFEGSRLLTKKQAWTQGDLPVLMGHVWHLRLRLHTAPDSVVVYSDGECSKS